MQSRKFLFTAIFIITGISIILGLQLFSFKINRSPNHFIRLFRPHTITAVKSIDLLYNSYYIAGATHNTVYLGNFTRPLYMVVADASLAIKDSLRLHVPDSMQAILQTGHLIADSPYFYIAGGSLPYIARGNLKSLIPEKFITDNIFISLYQPIGVSSFAVRTPRTNNLEFPLAKIQAGIPGIYFNSNALSNQSDGLFSTDGMLLHNKDLHRLIYIYFYRNQFICMDTNIHVLLQGKTIDTTSWANIKTARLNSSQTITLAAPPIVVNRKSATSKTLLFINSSLMADNEQRSNFEDAAAVDVYNLNSGRYLWSLYVFNQGKYQMRDFVICNNELIALQGHYLVAYQLDPKIFNE